MLILSRKVNEVIYIGPDISITFLGWHGASIKLGISAPREVEIFRDEVLQRQIAAGQTGRVKT